MKMYVLDNGEIIMKTSNQVSADGKTASIPIHCFLIEGSKGYILFDTGCDPDGMEKNWPEKMRLNPYVPGNDKDILGSLEKLGLKSDDIRYVVLSHLHLDHAGGLKFFPNADVFVNGDELAKTLKAYAKRDFSGFHMESDIESWLKAEIKWHPIYSDIQKLELDEGVTILNFGPGHSYGMLGLMVNLEKSGKFILASDTIYTKAHIGPPVQVAGIVYSQEGYVDTVNEIVRLAEKEKAMILFGHDIDQFKTLIKSSDGYYC
jgi:N-acyl homoserine lactone hydrolase